MTTIVNYQIPKYEYILNRDTYPKKVILEVCKIPTKYVIECRKRKCGTQTLFHLNEINE